MGSSHSARSRHADDEDWTLAHAAALSAGIDLVLIDRADHLIDPFGMFRWIEFGLAGGISKIVVIERFGKAAEIVADFAGGEVQQTLVSLCDWCMFEGPSHVGVSSSGPKREGSHADRRDHSPGERCGTQITLWIGCEIQPE